MLSTRHYSPCVPLRTTGYLYEGNFDAWQKWIASMFIAKGRPTQAYPSIAAINEEDGKPTYYDSSIQDIHDILERISPALKDRVPLNLVAKAGVLHAWLERLCEPFRLFDLPAELRVRIYGELTSDPVQWIHSQHGEEKCRIPKIAQTSHQLRKEVVPVYIANTTFCINAASCNSGSLMKKFLGAWKAVWPASCFASLRRFSLVMTADVYYPSLSRVHFSAHPIVVETWLKISFNETGGLRFDRLHEFKPGSQKMLSDICGEVEAQRRAEGLKGEAMLVLLDRLAAKCVDLDSHNWLGLELEDDGNV